MTQPVLPLTIDGRGFSLLLESASLPATAGALADVLPIEATTHHTKWSGPVCLVVGVKMPELPLENPMTFMALGDVGYHPVHKEFGIAYGSTQWRGPLGAVFVTRLGRLEGDLDWLAGFGRKLQRTGSRPFAIGLPGR